MSASPAAALLDPAGTGAGSVAAAAAELIGPLAGAATPIALPWTDQATSRVEIGVGLRYPLLLVTLLADLGQETLVVTTAVQSSGGGPQGQAPVRFEPWTPAGSALPAFAPTAGPDGLAGGFALTCQAQRIPAGGPAVQLSPADLAAIIRVDLIQGLLGRVLTVLLTEKAALHRAAREITAARALDIASGPTLDRIGADLGCARFRDELIWDATRAAPGAVPLSPPGTAEDDASFRSRLRVLRGTRLPSPAWVDTALNGAGDPSGPGSGWLADTGTTQRVRVDETANPLYLAFRLVAPGDPDGPAKLLQAVRQVHLIWPAGSAAGDAAHQGRMLPQPVGNRVSAVRAVLAGWQLPAGQPVAPALAAAMQVLDQRCSQLGVRPWPSLLAGQSDDGGSRFELGLGGLLAAPDPAKLDAAFTAATALGDPNVVPRPRAADPAGTWLLTACGFRTAEPLADGTVFISAAPMGPLELSLTPAPAGATVPIGVTATLVSAADAAHDTPMVEVVAAVTAQGTPAVAQPAALLAGIQPPPAGSGLPAALAALDLVAVSAVQGFLAQLATVSARDYAVFDLGAAATTQLLTDRGPLDRLLTVAAAAGASSVVPVVTAAGTLALILGVTGLPLAGSNLAGQHTILFRWQVRGLAGEPVDLAPRRGPSVQVRWPGIGVSVVSCLAQVRTGANDPYEWQPLLPPGALLTLRQYEHLMNIVELVTPVGVRADTWDVRQHHVDVDGSGQAHPLPPAAARSYRHYRSAP